MLLYKSVAAVQSYYRDYMKEKMRKARDNSLAKARVNTVNKQYIKHKRESSYMSNQSKSSK